MEKLRYKGRAVEVTGTNLVTEQDLHWKGLNTQEYQALAKRSALSMNEVQPLKEMEVNRPRLQGVTDVKPK